MYAKLVCVHYINNIANTYIYPYTYIYLQTAASRLETAVQEEADYYLQVQKLQEKFCMRLHLASGILY